jgi:esterase/lipase superfamily enzyme
MDTTHRLTIVVTLIALGLGGCAQNLRPPPASVYRVDGGDAFAKLSPELRSPTVDVLYVTDRKPETDASGALAYGNGRSRSLAYGSAVVELGGGRSWEELIAWTESAPGAGAAGLEERLVSVRERGRFPATPYLFSVAPNGRIEPDPEMQVEFETARTAASAELRRRLARAPRKDVLIFVHGIQTSFEGAVLDVGRGAHMFGHFGVHIAYTWPAGGTGLLSAYAYDRESGEFTVFHLKQLLRSLAEVPEVERVHVLAHSRGTDIVSTALRELIIEARAAGADPRRRYKLENLLLAAPDLDIEVVDQRFVAEALGSAFRRVTVYVSSNDSAIAAARNLFNSRARLGSVTPESLSDEQKASLRRASNIDLIAYRGQQAGRFGHGYFRNPAVLADAILLLRDGKEPGAAHGRPLEPIGDHFWVIRDDYLQAE